jgi:hypothetical protein
VKHLPTLVALLATTACSSVFGPSRPSAELATDRAVYATGDTGILVLANRGSSDIRHDGASCALLERRGAAGWEPAVSPWPHPCIVIAYPTLRLEPGQSDTASFAVDAAAFGPGDYRFAMLIDAGGRQATRRVLLSSAFTVLPGS